MKNMHLLILSHWEAPEFLDLVKKIYYKQDNGHSNYMKNWNLECVECNLARNKIVPAFSLSIPGNNDFGSIYLTYISYSEIFGFFRKRGYQEPGNLTKLFLMNRFMYDFKMQFSQYIEEIILRI